MRKGTVKVGLNMMAYGVFLITLVTFYHDRLSGMFGLTAAADSRFVFLGFAVGAGLGAVGVLVAAAGFVLGQRTRQGHEVTLIPNLILLTSALLLFAILLFASFQEPSPRKMRPGETLTI